jgi:GNAT superfamily N-acetyltransferase
MSDISPINLPDAPDIAGLRFRHYRRRDDFAAMVAVLEACQAHDNVDPQSPDADIPSIEEVEKSFTEGENIDLNTDLLLVEHDGAVIGFQWLRWWTQADSTWVYYHRGRVVPRWRGRGIGTATMRWAERRIKQLATEHDTGGKAVIRANTTMYEKDYNELLLTEGYEPIHSFIELGYDPAQPVPEGVLPEAFAIKPVLPDHYRLIWEANEEAFTEEWGRRATSVEDYIKFLGNIVGNPNVDVSLWQVAWHGDTIAGTALVEVSDRGIGEITDLSVRKAYRSQGLARALLVRAVRALQERGVERIRIFTDADDPFGARTLYEEIGFRVLTEYIRYQKPVEQLKS